MELSSKELEKHIRDTLPKGIPLKNLNYTVSTRLPFNTIDQMQIIKDLLDQGYMVGSEKNTLTKIITLKIGYVFASGHKN